MKYQNLSNRQLVNLLLERDLMIMQLQDRLRKKEAQDSTWDRESAQRDGGGFTDREILDSYRNNW